MTCLHARINCESENEVTSDLLTPLESRYAVSPGFKLISGASKN